MTLYKIEDFYPNYRNDLFEGDDIKGYDVYAGTNDEKIGNVDDALVDESGYFRYLVISTGFWVFGKRVLIPIGRCRVDNDNKRIYAMGLETKEQAENLPEYREDTVVDRQYEQNVRSIYAVPSVENSAAVEDSPPVEGAGVAATATGRQVMPPTLPQTPSRPTTTTTESDRLVAQDDQSYSYNREPSFYNTTDLDHKKLKLYEERLVAHKHREKTGEVLVSKRVVTEQAKTTIPVENEKVVVQIREAVGAEQNLAAGEVAFNDTEIARLEVYQESADIRKEAFVREEVEIRKEVERNTVEAEETLRHEKLEVKREGNPIVEDKKRP
ncbi:DUF2382 domain-containing protein [Laspinema olomoucense]|uniref:DUF2382 domain-containing protein n=1 Tax=Laspinema olomoucense TaxID=3231600 RepID=UPI0021BAA37E|nr:DUF2382 domain-containing protein [Laspinema sp. D3a]MCT7991327.1 DUF2382 domain-containing protein [Laspinema sp. D3a]